MYTMPVMMAEKVIDRMFKHMLLQGVSNKEMYTHLGVSKQRYYAWKSRASIPKDYLVPIAEKLGLNFVWFISGQGVETFSDDEDDYIGEQSTNIPTGHKEAREAAAEYKHKKLRLDTQEAQMLHSFRALDDATKQAMLTVMKHAQRK